MRGSEIRQKFLDYFKDKGHTIVPSSSLVPAHDPTLLFTNAGMVQFKDIFTGQIPRFSEKAATCQKCMRAGGKHNDLENVGRTARHHTFFEMLGNFSFGDYFKQSAILMAWEFLTDVLCLPKEQLWVTIFNDDDEAAHIWHNQVGISTDRIQRMGEKDNFWAMGDTGPCGPCSEILIDQGPEFSCGNPDCKVGCDCDRYLELWNLVFMQFQRHEDGSLAPLPRPSIDTGMGLERITAVLQSGKSNYDSDLFTPLIRDIEKEAHMQYGKGHKADVSFRVISDHIRALTFLLADGVLPSNEGRGYVLRRIIRRAARHGKLINIDKPFLHHLVPGVTGVMKDTYPELKDRLSYISTVVKQEEERFQYALDRGLELLSGLIESAKKKGESLIPGGEIFRLYDTFGFPLDLTREIIAEQGLGFNQNEFEGAMEKQREKARRAWQGSGEKQIKGIYKQLSTQLPKTSFLGYDALTSTSQTLALIRQDEKVDEAKEGEQIEVILDQTPFYSEKGGQIGDTGTFRGDHLYAEVVSTLSQAGIALHQVKIKKGALKAGQTIQAEVDHERRMSIALNHTATHLLHSALKNVLGDHVRQAGSLVAPDRLRFDFTHFAPLNAEEIKRIESMVNDQIRSDTPVIKKEMSLKEALADGATALFGEKYQDWVRVIRIADFSSELCGGTHCKSTGQIGLMIILSETGIAAGVRRIEGITGKTAFHYLQALREKIAGIAMLLKAPETELKGKVENMMEQLKEAQRTLKDMKMKATNKEIGSIIDRVRETAGIRILTYRAQADSMDIEGLRHMIDMISDKLGSGVIVLASEIKGKANILVKVSKDLTKRLNAVDLIRVISKHVGGSGGGRPDMAQAGGSNPGGIDKALQVVPDTIKDLVKMEGA